MKEKKSPSFLNSEPEDIERAQLVDQLLPGDQSGIYKSSRQTCCCAWSPGNECFAWSSGARTVQIIPWKKRQEQNKRNSIYHQSLLIDCGEYVCSIAFGFSSDSNRQQWSRLKVFKKLILATGLQSGRIKLWDAETGNILTELIDHKDVVQSLSFSSKGSLHLASASRDGAIKLWDLTHDGNMYRTLRPQCKWAHDVCWSPDSKFIACTGSYKCAVVWPLDEDKKPLRLEGHYHDVVGCTFSPDGALLATASYDTRVIIWDPYTGDAIVELGHLFPPPRPIYAGGANDHYVRNVSFCNDGIHVASVCDDQFVRIWNLYSKDEPVLIVENENAVCCRFSPEGRTVAVGMQNGSVDFHAGRAEIPPLMHISRTVIRRSLSTQAVDHLTLPLRLKEFLKYRDLCM